MACVTAHYLYWILRDCFPEQQGLQRRSLQIAWMYVWWCCIVAGIREDLHRNEPCHRVSLQLLGCSDPIKRFALVDCQLTVQAGLRV